MMPSSVSSTATAGGGDQSQGFSVGNMTFGSNGVAQNNNMVFIVGGALVALYLLTSRKK